MFGFGLGWAGLMILVGREAKILEEGAQIYKYYFWAENILFFFFRSGGWHLWASPRSVLGY